jgi:hypothetical protein
MQDMVGQGEACVKMMPRRLALDALSQPDQVLGIAGHPE